MVWNEIVFPYYIPKPTSKWLNDYEKIAMLVKIRGMVGEVSTSIGNGSTPIGNSSTPIHNGSTPICNG